MSSSLPLPSHSREEMLYEAAEAGRLEDVQHLLGLSLDGGGSVDINWANPGTYRWGQTPLSIASSNGQADVVALLLQHGADANKACMHGYTPLYRTSFNGHVALVTLLLQHGADVNIAGREGQTPLYWASLKDHTLIVSLLLQHGADVNKADNYSGYTPLHKASHCGHLSVATILLQHNADVNKANKDLETPLHAASSEGYLDLVRILLNAGANPHSMDNNGLTPRQVACRRDFFKGSKANVRKSIWDAIDRWPVTMTILCLKELGFYHYVDMSMIDLIDFVGLEQDFLAMITIVEEEEEEEEEEEGGGEEEVFEVEVFEVEGGVEWLGDG